MCTRYFFNPYTFSERNPQVVKNIEILSKKAICVLLPLFIIFPRLVNLCFYYLGLGFEENIARKIGFLLINSLFAVAVGLLFLKSLCQNRLSQRQYILTGLVALYFIAVCLLGLLRFGLEAHLVTYLRQMVVFCVPAFMVGMIAGKKRLDQSLTAQMEKLSFFVLPAAVIYLNGRLFQCNPFGYGAYLGMFNYMELAYLLMMPLLCLTLRFVEKAPFTFPLVNRDAAHPQLIRGVLIAVFWLSMISSGTRGSYVCVTAFCVLLAVLECLWGAARRKRALLAAAAIIGVLAFNLFIYAPSGFGVSRMDIFLEGLASGQITTAGGDEEIREYMDSLVAADGNEQLLNKEENSTPVEPETPDTSVELETPDTSAEPETPAVPEVDATLKIDDRGTMFTLAAKEFLKSPLFGMGFGGYAVKYGTYPHNAVFELLCETGIVGTVSLLAVILVLLIKLFTRSKADLRIREMLLLCLTYAVQVNISGSIWCCSMLFLALGYAIALDCPESRTLRSSKKKP